MKYKTHNDEPGIPRALAYNKYLYCAQADLEKYLGPAHLAKHSGNDFDLEAIWCVQWEDGKYQTIWSGRQTLNDNKDVIEQWLLGNIGEVEPNRLTNLIYQHKTAQELLVIASYTEQDYQII